MSFYSFVKKTKKNVRQIFLTKKFLHAKPVTINFTAKELRFKVLARSFERLIWFQLDQRHYLHRPGEKVSRINKRIIFSCIGRLNE